MDLFSLLNILEILKQAWTKVSSHCKRDLPPEYIESPTRPLKLSFMYAFFILPCVFATVLIGSWTLRSLTQGNPTFWPIFLAVMLVALSLLGAGYCSLMSIGCLIDSYRSKRAQSGRTRTDGHVDRGPIHPA